MGDEATIDEIIDDVDIDKVSLIFCCIPTVFYDGSVWNLKNTRKMIFLCLVSSKRKSKFFKFFHIFKFLSPYIIEIYSYFLKPFLITNFENIMKTKNCVLWKLFFVI